MERYPSGQRDQTVNLAAHAFEGSNPSLSTILLDMLEAFRRFERRVKSFSFNQVGAFYCKCSKISDQANAKKLVDLQTRI